MRESVALVSGLGLLFLTWAINCYFDERALDNSVTDDVGFAAVRPIFGARCSKCHVGATDWTNYAIAKEHSAEIKMRVILFKNMPPLGNEIDDKERDLIRKWIEQGAKS